MKISTIFDVGNCDRMDQGIDATIEGMTDSVIDAHFASVCENVKAELAKRRAGAEAPAEDPT